MVKKLSKDTAKNSQIVTGSELHNAYGRWKF